MRPSCEPRAETAVAARTRRMPRTRLVRTGGRAIRGALWSLGIGGRKPRVTMRRGDERPSIAGAWRQHPGALQSRRCLRPQSSAAASARRSSRPRCETLRLELLEAQRALQKAGVPVILLLAGADGAGKGETVKRLLEWLDTRGLDTHAFGPPTDEERERPLWWRYWMRLPPRGRIGIFFGSWYSEPLVERAFGRLSRSRYDGALSEIAIFEQMLAEDGALIVKLWIHLSKKGLEKRLRRLENEPRHALEGDQGRLEALPQVRPPSSRPRSTRSGGPTRASRPGSWSRPPTSAIATSWRADPPRALSGRPRADRGPPHGPRRPRRGSGPAPRPEPGGVAHRPRPRGPRREAGPGGVPASGSRRPRDVSAAWPAPPSRSTAPRWSSSRAGTRRARAATSGGSPRPWTRGPTA